MKKIVFIIVFLLGKLQAQDLRAVYLQHKWVSGYTYSFNLKLYCEAALDMNRPFVNLDYWGASSSFSIGLAQSFTVSGVSVKTYTGSYTFSGAGYHYVSYQDTFRIANIKNLQNSSKQDITSTSFIRIDQLIAPNTAPYLQNHPINFTIENDKIVYDPAFYDVDGDSMVFTPVGCCQQGYYIPGGATVNSFGKYSFSKDSIGIYAFSYQVEEWRKVNNTPVIIGLSQIDFVMEITNDVGIKMLENKNELMVYPVPAKVDLNLKNETDVSYSFIRIMDLSGKTVFELPYAGTIDVSKLPAGHYLLFLVSGNKISHTKFVKE